MPYLLWFINEIKGFSAHYLVLSFVIEIYFIFDCLDDGFLRFLIFGMR
jgi:hypothetical protein